MREVACLDLDARGIDTRESPLDERADEMTYIGPARRMGCVHFDYANSKLLSKHWQILPERRPYVTEIVSFPNRA